MTKEEVSQLALKGRVPKHWEGGLCRHRGLGAVFLPAQQPGPVTPYAVVTEEYSAHSYRDHSGAYYQPSVVAYIPIEISEAWDAHHAELTRKQAREFELMLELNNEVSQWTA